MANLTPIEQALQIVGNQIVAQERINLQRNGNDNSGKLSKSIKAEVVEGKLIISMLNYGKWVNDGHERKAGRKPPLRAIQFWIAKNNITPRGGITAKQLPFAIQAGIGKRGQINRRAFPFIEPAYKSVLSKDLGGIFGKAIEKIIREYFKKGK